MEAVRSLTLPSRRTLISAFSRLRTSGGQADPLPIYDTLRSAGDICAAPWGGYLVNSYDACHRILRDKSWRVPDHSWRIANSDAARWGSPSFLQMNETLPMKNPPEHTRMRRSLGNPFNPAALASMRLSVEAVVERQLDALGAALKEGPADFTELVSEEIPVLAIGEWMKLPSSDYPLLRALTHDQVFTQELFPTASEISISDAATARLRSYFSHLVSERRQTLGTDPISSWIRHWDAVESAEATDEAVRSLALFMVLAALETSSHLLANVVRLLIEHPQQCHDLQEHADLVPDAIEEVLRFDAPIHMITRVAATPTEVSGVLVDAGEMVHLMIGSAHHDPRHYDEPDRFNIRRRRNGKGPASHLAFGAGIHYCLGNALARLEAEVLLKALIKRRMTNLRIHTPPTWAPRVVFRRMTSLIVATA